jgi:hypothetical protein
MGPKKQKRVPKKSRRPLDRAVDSYGCVPASVVADQWFCEVKVDLELGHPEVDRGPEDISSGAAEPAAWERSREQHAALADGADARPHDVIRKQIRTGKPVVVTEFGLGADFDDLPIGGIPDAVCFESRRAVCVLDYKSKDFVTAPQLFPSDEVQLQLYGLLLEHFRHASQDLMLACVYFPSSAPLAGLGESKLKRVPQLCWDAVRELSTMPAVGRSAMHHPIWTRPGLRIARGLTVSFVAVRYHPQDAKKYIAWATPYWLGKRPPMPTSRPQRCAACRVNPLGLCAVARAPFGGFR